MRDNRKDQLQGTLDLLVLRTLATGGAMHGYSILDRIETISREVIRIEPGSLYPALHRMEESGWVSAKWMITENKRRARVYEITAAGRKQLKETEGRWRAVTTAIDQVLQRA
jgi:PadR family transcriptional regulator